MDVLAFLQRYRALNLVFHCSLRVHRINKLEFFILILLDQYPQLRAGDIAESLKISSARLSQRLRSLEKLDYLVSRPGKDRREKSFELSEAARGELQLIEDAVRHAFTYSRSYAANSSSAAQLSIQEEIMCLAAIGLKSDELVVLALGSELNYASSIANIVAATGLLQPNVSQLCKTLQHQGVVTKSCDETEARLSIVELTSRGLKRYQELATRIEGF